jgi:GxxExxY protein
MKEKDHLNGITRSVVESAFRIHTKLGPGLLESVYETILARDLVRRGHSVERQRAVSFEFEGLSFQDALRLDLMIDGAVIVEIKCVSKIAVVHERQLLTYLRLLDCRVGLLLNFGTAWMKDGVKRVVNNF